MIDYNDITDTNLTIKDKVWESNYIYYEIHIWTHNKYNYYIYRFTGRLSK